MRAKNIDLLTQGEITNAVGLGDTPFVTGVLEVLDADIFLNQWTAQWQQWLNAADGERSQFNIDFQTTLTGIEQEWQAWLLTAEGNVADLDLEFQTWFSTIQGQLEGDIAANLAAQILSLQNTKADTTYVDTEIDKQTTKTAFNAFVTKIEKSLANYNSYASSKDDNGVFTIVQYKRANDTLYMKSTVSNPDADGNYQTNIWELYNDTGVTVTDTITWTITYDADGDILSKVVN